MKAACFAVMILLTVNVLALAQQDPNDPGMQDSIIIQTIVVDQPMRSVLVNVSFVTDEAVSFFNLPITWSSENDSLYPEDIYVNPSWDLLNLFDTISVETHFISVMGSFDSPGINTYGHRENIFGIHFQITNFQPQIIGIDTTYDPRNGPVVFVLGNGEVSFTPAVVGGSIIYGPFAGTDNGNAIPGDFQLSQNYPNPFNAKTTISYSLPKAGSIILTIYNLLGQKVATLFDGIQQAGENKVVWDAKDVTSGIYFYRLKADKIIETKRMLLLR
jgi:hypothetical protein